MRRLVVLLFIVSCSRGTGDDLGTERQEASVTVVPRSSTWSYWDRGGDLGTSWRAPDFDDGGWARGAGPLGYGESYQQTTLSYGPDADHKYVTSYFRHDFTLESPSASALHAELIYDDGVVVYLNGTEVATIGMPDGTVTADTYALGHETGNNYVELDWSEHANLIVQGENTVAVEVHQTSPGSSDLMFDLALQVETSDEEPPPPDDTEIVVVGEIERERYWAWWDQGGSPGAGWYEPNFSASGWGSGGPAPYGYGEDYINQTVSYGPSYDDKHITTYFRESFRLGDPVTATLILGEVMYDDGVVIYLNGVEIQRLAMPGGSIDAETRSLGHEANQAYERFDWSDHTDLLVQGSNWVAVEVHQLSSSSSDLVFDLSIQVLAEQSTEPPAASEDRIARGSEWRYWDGDYQPAGWGGTSYDDSHWKVGAAPLGYGESYVQTQISYGGDPGDKHTTAYFRKWVDIDEPTLDTRIFGGILYDDGVVVHINGREVARRDMPATYTRFETLAEGHESGDYEPFEWEQAREYLVPGPNLIAVEVHQVSSYSSDMTFDLELEIVTPEACGIPACGDPVAPAPDTNLYAVWAGDQSVWAAGADGIVGRTYGDGQWCWCAPNPDINWLGLWGANDDDVWVVGESGNVVRIRDHSMSVVDLGVTGSLTDIWGVSADQIIVVGGAGTVRSFDGDSWAVLDLETDPQIGIATVWAPAADEIFVGGSAFAPYPGDSTYDGSSALIYRWTPSEGWNLEVEETMYYGHASIRAIHGTGPTDIWAVGSNHPAGAASSYSHVKHFDGSEWTNGGVTGDQNQGQFSSVVAAPDEVLVGNGGGKPSLRFDRESWTRTDALVNRLNDLARAGDGTVWAVGNDGKILRRDGFGWTRDR